MLEQGNAMYMWLYSVDYSHNLCAWTEVTGLMYDWLSLDLLFVDLAGKLKTLARIGSVCWMPCGEKRSFIIMWCRGY